MKRALLAVLIGLTGCGAPAIFAGGKSLPAGSPIAVLTPLTAEPMSRERVSFFQASLARELESSGYRVVDQRRVDTACRAADCSGTPRLSEHFPDAVVAQLRIERIRRLNLLAAYYNSISGTLDLTSPDGSELITVRNTQRERGGLVFNSGQVFQGLTETVSNVRHKGADSIAEKFVHELVAKLPEPTETSPQARLEQPPEIGSKTMTRKGFNTSVCVTGDPGNTASVVEGRSRATLLEVTPGNYCGTVPSILIASGTPEVELLSPLGQRSRSPLAGTTPAACSTPATVVRTGDRLSLECNGPGCGACPDERFLVYRSESASGPFIKVGTLPKSGWPKGGLVERSRSPVPPVLAVVKQLPNGQTTAPVVFLPES